MKKQFKALLAAIAFSIAGLTTVYGSGWTIYTSTYDMTGGIYTKQTFKVNEKMVVTINPVKGRLDCKIGIYKYTEHWYGNSRSECIETVSSVNSSSTTIKDKGTYGIYLRNYSGFQYNGDLRIQYK